MPAFRELYKPLNLTVDEKGWLTGTASFYIDYQLFQGNKYSYDEFRTGVRVSSIISPEPSGLVITGMRCTSLDTWYNGRLLGELEIECSNDPKVEDAESANDFNFQVSIQSEIYTETYNGMSYWAGIDAALAGEKEWHVPYVILTLTGDYRLMGTPIDNSVQPTVRDVAFITSYMNTVNSAAFDLSQFSNNLGAVAAGCMKFVGFSYDESYDNESAAIDPETGKWKGPKCQASFTFHIRGFDWNYKIRSAQIQLDPATHQELYWQKDNPNALTYIDNCKPAFIPAGGKDMLANTPIWVGQNSQLEGEERLGMSEYDKEIFPVRSGESAGQGLVNMQYEFPYKDISVLFPMAVDNG